MIRSDVAPGAAFIENFGRISGCIEHNDNVFTRSSNSRIEYLKKLNDKDATVFDWKYVERTVLLRNLKFCWIQI